MRKLFLVLAVLTASLAFLVPANAVKTSHTEPLFVVPRLASTLCFHETSSDTNYVTVSDSLSPGDELDLKMKVIGRVNYDSCIGTATGATWLRPTSVRGTWSTTWNANNIQHPYCFAFDKVAFNFYINDLDTGVSVNPPAFYVTCQTDGYNSKKLTAPDDFTDRAMQGGHVRWDAADKVILVHFPDKVLPALGGTLIYAQTKK